MKCKGKIVGLDLDFISHKPKLTLQLNNQELIGYDDVKDLDIVDITLEKPRKGRNNDQNALYWKLLNELSRKLKIGVEELHFSFLKQYSVRYEILVPSDVELRGIEYKEKKSKIMKGSKEFIVYHVYTPSHELKTDEFAILLKGLCEECETQGIPTIYDEVR